jgi:hypothetical protein
LRGGGSTEGSTGNLDGAAAAALRAHCATACSSKPVELASAARSRSPSAASLAYLRPPLQTLHPPCWGQPLGGAGRNLDPRQGLRACHRVARVASHAGSRSVLKQVAAVGSRPPSPSTC